MTTIEEKIAAIAKKFKVKKDLYEYLSHRSKCLSRILRIVTI